MTAFRRIRGNWNGKRCCGLRSEFTAPIRIASLREEEKDMAEAKPRLQPLRIPGGWKTDVNMLYELEPSPDTMDRFYGPILFSATHRNLGHEIYVRWEPEGDPLGRFLLQRYLLKFDEKGSSVLEGYLVDSVYFRERLQLVDRLEMYMELSKWT